MTDAELIAALVAECEREFGGWATAYSVSRHNHLLTAAMVGVALTRLSRGGAVESWTPLGGASTARLYRPRPEIRDA